MKRANQPYIPGMEPSPQSATTRRFGRHGYYFAFRPDAAARDAALALQSRLRQEGDASAVKRDNLHVSLFPLWEGEHISPDLIEIAKTHVQAIDGKPFEFKFDMAMSFARKNGYCTVLAASHAPSELYTLQRKFASRFEGIVKAGSLTPHMTLLYTDHFMEKKPVAPVRWMAREFLLIRSFIGLGRQDVLGRWPLR
jgi:2'-5' RNA ligase